MTNPDLVEIVCLCDNSGSMESMKGAAIAGFNALLYDQQTLMNAADAIFSLVFFNSKHYTVYDAVDIGEVKPLTPNTYMCNHQTAMYDAIGYTIEKILEKHRNMNESDIPGTVLFAIITDGEENDSERFTSSRDIKNMITERMRRDNWMFNYLSSESSARHDADQIGIPSENVLELKNTKEGMTEGYIKISTAYSKYRTGAANKVNL